MDSGETDVEFHYHIMFAPEQIANPYNSLVCNIKLQNLHKNNKHNH